MYEDINEFPPIENEVVAPEDGAATSEAEEAAEEVALEEVVAVEEAPVVEEVATEDAPIVEEVVETPAPRRNRKKGSIETVTVITETRNGTVGVDFRGFGLRLQTENNYNRGDIVQVRYDGIITTPNFKAELV